MKARPILFKPDMVNAILEGRKTQTRRIVKPQPEMVSDRRIEPWEGEPAALKILLERNKRGCPYGAPGDLLWVRETTEEDCFGNVSLSRYVADGAPVLYFDRDDPNSHGARARWDYLRLSRPSIHMPRWASRLTLSITNVRVERLQDITIDDLCAEGVGDMLEDSDTIAGRAFNRAEHYAIAGAGGVFAPEIIGFAEYWDSINGPGSWAANPWVWVVEFQPHHMNVDAFLRDREVA